MGVLETLLQILSEDDCTNTEHIIFCEWIQRDCKDPVPAKVYIAAAMLTIPASNLMVCFFICLVILRILNQFYSDSQVYTQDSLRGGGREGKRSWYVLTLVTFVVQSSGMHEVLFSFCGISNGKSLTISWDNKICWTSLADLLGLVLSSFCGCEWN